MFATPPSSAICVQDRNLNRFQVVLLVGGILGVTSINLKGKQFGMDAFLLSSSPVAHSILMKSLADNVTREEKEKNISNSSSTFPTYMATTCKHTVLSYPQNQSCRDSWYFWYFWYGKLWNLQTNLKVRKWDILRSENTVFKSREEHFETEILIWPDDMRLVTPWHRWRIQL